VVSVQSGDAIELCTWGPYPTTLGEEIGETVGIASNMEFTIGLQALNPKTLGGFPWQDNDCMPQLDIFESGDYSDMSEKGKRYVLYRVEAAKPTDFGSTLQAYCRNRDQARIGSNWNHDFFEIPAFDDGGIIGSKIALFGAPKGKALEAIGQIEIAENLPHPTIDGQWGKQARSASAAYMIMGFGEQNIDQAIQYTQDAGLRYLYHSGPFKNWGAFELNETSFPNGRQGLKDCVEKAKAADLMIGVHTLSNFITTDDPYVSPVPDSRLAKVGSSKLASDLDARSKEIQIEDPKFFNQFRNNHLRTIQIGQELIRYGSISDSEPWTLADCERGAFGTQVSPHPKGTIVSKLADHGYKVFLSNAELTQEMGTTLADLFNETGLRQISFDGLEGNRSTGMGNYGEILFTNSWYQQLDPSIQQHYIADASRTSHYFWHMYTRMNWGEPWYADFRESQTEYRLKNQAYFKRNLMPGMLGWFSMRDNTSIEDIEWMLARSAAFNAGYGFVCNPEVLQKNGNTSSILALIGLWEKARMQDIFSPEQKQRMEDVNKEFSLNEDEQGNYSLQEIASHKFQHLPKVRQPGEPTTTTFNWEQVEKGVSTNFLISAIDTDLKKVQIEWDNYKTIEAPWPIKAGQFLRFKGQEWVLYDAFYQPLKRKPATLELDLSAKGNHSAVIDAEFSNSGQGPKLKLEIRVPGAQEPVGKLEL